MRKIKLTGRPSHLDPIEVGEIIELIPMNDNKGYKYIAVHTNEPFYGRCDHCALNLGDYMCKIPRIECKPDRTQGKYLGTCSKLCVDHNVYFRPVDDVLENI